MLGSVLFCASLHSYAGCVGPVVNGECLSGTQVQGYNYGSTDLGSNDSGYRSNSGTRYQYDLSNPSDRNRYSIDLDAQRRDSMSLSNGRDRDRRSGQYGGGVYDD